MFKQKLLSAQEFMKRNQTKILAATAIVATTAAVAMRVGLAQHNAFLKEHNLYEEFYALDENE